MVDLGCGRGMDILSRAECFNHMLILRDMRQHTQLDLRIVRVDQHMVVIRRNEHAAQFAPQLGTHRDILQIRVGRRQAAGRRDRLLEMRVDAAILRADDLEQSLDIGAFELAQLPVFQNARHDRVIVCNALEHLDIGRVPGFCLFRRGQMQFFK